MFNNNNNINGNPTFLVPFDHPIFQPRSRHRGHPLLPPSFFNKPPSITHFIWRSLSGRTAVNAHSLVTYLRFFLFYFWGGRVFFILENVDKIVLQSLQQIMRAYNTKMYNWLHSQKWVLHPYSLSTRLRHCGVPIMTHFPPSWSRDVRYIHRSYVVNFSASVKMRKQSRFGPILTIRLIGSRSAQ